MPRMKMNPKDKTSAYRRMVTLTPPVAKKVEAMAEEESRSTSAMLRILIERAINSLPSSSGSK